MEEVDQSKRATLRRFAALGAASPLVALASSSESDAPEALAGYLSATPGAHFSKIRDDLQLGTGEAQYHLRRLESDGAIESFKDGDYRRYFPADRFSSFERTVLGYLRRDTPRGIVVGLLVDPSHSATSLAAKLGVARSTISKYAGHLEEAGILTREDGYTLIEPETILLLLVRYADSFDAAVAAAVQDADELVRYDP